MADAIRLTRIDEANIGDHFHLTPNDECYFLFEYTSGRDYLFSATNSLISNLKKKPTLRGSPGYHYKERAIASCARDFAGAIKAEWLDVATLVPVPGSKASGHPDYDDRMTRMCRSIRTDPPVDVRQLISQSGSLDAAHESGGIRPTVEQLLGVYELDESQTSPDPTTIGIFDDVLTAGVHYRAVQKVLSARFPGVPIFGFFVARRVFPDPFEALEP